MHSLPLVALAYIAAADGPLHSQASLLESRQRERLAADNLPALLLGMLLLGGLVYRARVRELRRRASEVARQLETRTRDLSAALETVARQAHTLRALEAVRSRPVPPPLLATPAEPPALEASREAMLRKVSGVLSEHLPDPEFQVDQMSVALGMSRSTLYRSLRRTLGKSPMDVLFDYRLAQAAQRLSSSHVTVSEVAYGVGFRSVPHFCSKFRERYGETPSGYRSSRTPPVSGALE